jgi:hypothetical protein
MEAFLLCLIGFTSLKKDATTARTSQRASSVPVDRSTTFQNENPDLKPAREIAI